jgi:hypothetical protein
VYYVIGANGSNAESDCVIGGQTDGAGSAFNHSPFCRYLRVCSPLISSFQILISDSQIPAFTIVKGNLSGAEIGGPLTQRVIGEG